MSPSFFSHNVERSHGGEQSEPELTTATCVCPAWARCNRVKVPRIMNLDKIQILAYGNCGIMRFRGKEAYGKDMSPRTETSYKADGAGELVREPEPVEGHHTAKPVVQHRR